MSQCCGRKHRCILATVAYKRGVTHSWNHLKPWQEHLIVSCISHLKRSDLRSTFLHLHAVRCFSNRISFCFYLYISTTPNPTAIIVRWCLKVQTIDYINKNKFWIQNTFTLIKMRSEKDQLFTGRRHTAKKSLGVRYLLYNCSSCHHFYRDIFLDCEEIIHSIYVLVVTIGTLI